MVRALRWGGAALLAALVAPAGVAQRPAAGRIGPEVYLGVRLPSAIAWSPDGRRIAYELANAAGDEIRVVTLGTGATTTINRTLPRPRYYLDHPGLTWSSDGGSIFYRSGPQYYRVDAAGGAPTPLLTDTLPREIVQLSPTRTAVSFIRQGEIWVQDVSGGPPRQVTQGQGFLTAGRGELFSRLGQWPEWSPDGRKIAFAVPVEGNVRVGIVDVTGATTRLVGSTDRKWAFARMDWAPDGKQLAIARMNADYTRKQLIVVSDSGGAEKLIWEDQDNKWIAHNIEPGFETSWSPDGTRLAFVSIKTGWRHLYLADRASNTVRQVTEGPYEITSAQWSPTGDRLIVVSSRDDLQSLRLWSVDPSSGSARLVGSDKGIALDSDGRGDFPRPLFAPDGKQVAFVWSGPSDPYQIRVAAVTGQSPPAVVYSAIKDGFDPAAMARMEAVSFPSADGTLIRGVVYRPRNRPLGGPRIGLVHMYGGWGQLATLGWGIPFKSRLFHYLAGQGVTVLVVDPRGSDGYGADFSHGLYHDAAGKQSEDLVAAARFLAARGDADAKRIALYGHSYAGFLTLATMVQAPGVFGAGIVQAGVFDFPFFIPLEVPYAKIRFGSPELYQARGRPARHLDRLTSPMLVAHGSGDFNAQHVNSELLVTELMRAKKDFEFISYPGEPHRWEHAATDRDFLVRVNRFLIRTLKTPAPERESR